jgi:hypothetical protein
MRRISNQTFGLAILAGVGVGIGCGYLISNKHLRTQIGRKFRRIGRAAKYVGSEVRETAGELLEKGEREFKEAQKAGRRVYEKLAG